MTLPLQPFQGARFLLTAPNQNDDPDVFPLLAGQMFMTEKTPTWSTKVAISASRIERRQKRWASPQWTFKIAYEVLRASPTFLELQRLYAFFNAHAGQFQEFLYLDPSDHTASGETIGVGDGTTTTFQLSRTMGVGGNVFNEPVLATTGFIQVYVAGTQVTTFSPGPNGTIIFATPPAAGAAITWSGTFYFVCRFNQDSLPVAQMMTDLWSQDGIEFISR